MAKSAAQAQSRAMIYARISRDSEGDGEGIERQIFLCQQRADELGLEVVGIESDNDIGASSRSSKKPRPGYDRLIEAIRSGAVTHVLIYSNSRLTRRPRELEDIVDLYDETERRFGKEQAVKFIAYNAGMDDLATGQGRMVARIKAAVDANESDTISERAREKHKQSARNGKVKRQAKRPFGFLDDCVTHHPVEAPLIRAAVDDILRGATITQIARKWEKAGVKTTTGNDLWRWFPLRRVLLGWRTAGIREYNGEPMRVDNELVKAEWEPIISVEERTLALEMLALKSKTKKRQGNWLLSGLLRCGKCGRPLYGSLGSSKKQPPPLPEDADLDAARAHMKALEAYEKTHTYACNSERSSHLGISARRLESYVELNVAAYLMAKEVYGVPEDAPVIAEDWPHEDRLTELTTKINQLNEAFNSGALDGEIYIPQVTNLSNERKQLRAERDTFYASQAIVNRRRSTSDRLEIAADKMLDRLRDTFEDRQLRVASEVESVVILPGLRGNAGKSDEAFESRIKIVWREPHYDFSKAATKAAAEEQGVTDD